jgi:hypothetical protein
MRLAVRCLLGMMTAIENGLDEVVNQMRQDPKFDLPGAESARKQQRDARRTLACLLDQMIDTGYGEE